MNLVGIKKSIQQSYIKSIYSEKQLYEFVKNGAITEEEYDFILEFKVQKDKEYEAAVARYNALTGGGGQSQQ